MKLSSDEIKFYLKKLDEDEDIEVNDWEANFLDSIFTRWKNRELKEGQIEKAMEILEKYKVL